MRSQGDVRESMKGLGYEEVRRRPAKTSNVLVRDGLRSLGAEVLRI